MKSLQKGVHTDRTHDRGGHHRHFCRGAIPACTDYIARSQVAEAVTLLGGAKTPISEYVAERAAYPTALTEVVVTTSGRYVASFTGAGDATNITLVATMATAGVNNAVAGATLQLPTADGGRNWTCTAGGTVSPPVPAGGLPSLSGAADGPSGSLRQGN